MATATAGGGVSAPELVLGVVGARMHRLSGDPLNPPATPARHSFHRGSVRRSDSDFLL